jgi:RimJ/RimL family protein N-acetyltransferase
VLPIRTDRVELRVIEEGDLDEVHAILGDPDTAGSRSFFQPDSASTKRWIERRQRDQAEHGFSMWGAGLLHTGELVALAGLFPRTPLVAEIGYVVRVDHQRRGLATELVSSIVKATDAVGLDLVATIRSSNAASLRVADRAGFVVHQASAATGADELLLLTRPSKSL